MSRDNGLIRLLVGKLEQTLVALEKSGLAELVELYRRPRRLIWLSFVSGVARGFGIAVGFTAIGAVFILVLARVAALNLPIIGEFIADLARIVQNELSLPKVP